MNFFFIFLNEINNLFLCTFILILFLTTRLMDYFVAVTHFQCFGNLALWRYQSYHTAKAPKLWYYAQYSASFIMNNFNSIQLSIKLCSLKCIQQLIYKIVYKPSEYFISKSQGLIHYISHLNSLYKIWTSTTFRMV